MARSESNQSTGALTGQSVALGKPADYDQEIVRRRSRITASLVGLSGLRVLDFGAGNGAQTFEIAGHGCMIDACDVDENHLAQLGEFAKSHGITSVRPVRYGGTKLPFPDETFDAAVSFAVLEHVRDEDVSLREIHRVLKPGGHFIISVPNKWWIFETHGARLPFLRWNRVPFFSWVPKFIHSRFAHARIYTKNDLVRLLRGHGFEILKACYVTAPMDVVKTKWLKTLLRRGVFRGDVTPFSFLATEVLVKSRRT